MNDTRHILYLYLFKQRQKQGLPDRGLYDTADYIYQGAFYHCTDRLVQKVELLDHWTSSKH